MDESQSSLPFDASENGGCLEEDLDEDLIVEDAEGLGSFSGGTRGGLRVDPEIQEAAEREGSGSIDEGLSPDMSAPDSPLGYGMFPEEEDDMAMLPTDLEALAEEAELEAEGMRELPTAEMGPTGTYGSEEAQLLGEQFWEEEEGQAEERGSPRRLEDDDDEFLMMLDDGMDEEDEQPRLGTPGGFVDAFPPPPVDEDSPVSVEEQEALYRGQMSSTGFLRRIAGAQSFGAEDQAQAPQQDAAAEFLAEAEADRAYRAMAEKAAREASPPPKKASPRRGSSPLVRHAASKDSKKLSPLVSEGRSAPASDRGAESAAASEGRGSVTSHLETASEKAAKVGQNATRRKGKRATRNIFLEFGMDSDAKAMTEIKIGDVVVKRVNIKRFWQSEQDLHRWQSNLSHNSRFDKLSLAERARFHEDFRSDRAELRDQHNGFRRQKTAPFINPKSTSACEIKEIRQKLEPKEMKKKEKHANNLKELLGMKREHETTARDLAVGSESGDVYKEVNDAAKLESQATTEALQRFSEFVIARFGTLEDAWDHLDKDRDSQLSISEFLSFVATSGLRQDGVTIMRLLDKSADGLVSVEEFMRLKQHITKANGASPMSSVRHSRSDGALGGSSASSSSQVQGVRTLPAKVPLTAQEQFPRTAALLIFRNGESSHKGEPVLVRRWPPSSMAELLKVCSATCPTLIMPAMKLLDVDLRVVRSPADVAPGRAYLLKGTEALDPPPLFYDHKARGVASTTLKHVEREMHSAVAEQDRSLPLSPKHLSFASISQASTSPAGSPPWLSQERVERSAAGLKWQGSHAVQAQMGWGGLNHPQSHHHFHTWSRVLPADRSRRSASSSVL